MIRKFQVTFFVMIMLQFFELLEKVILIELQILTSINIFPRLVETLNRVIMFIICNDLFSQKCPPDNSFSKKCQKT